MNEIHDAYARIDTRGSITIPAAIRKALGLHAGEQVRMEVKPETGTITIHPQVSVDREQAWFWTPEWQEAERKADKDIASGKIKKMRSRSILKEMES
jgi:AbrB family looped-hinge helix DNA binding protein